MDIFIYLHGFNSSGASAKGLFFRQALAPATVKTPSYPPDPDAAVHCLRTILDSVRDRDTNLRLIGSSLGAYYAQYLAREYGIPAILINPALHPGKTLTPFLGWQKNFYTGENYYFGESELDKLAKYAIAQPCANPVPTLVLLDSGDELIDYREALALYSSCAQTRVFPGGDHAFQHLSEASSAIRDFLSKL